MPRVSLRPAARSFIHRLLLLLQRPNFVAIFNERARVGLQTHSSPDKKYLIPPIDNPLCWSRAFPELPSSFSMTRAQHECCLIRAASSIFLQSSQSVSAALEEFICILDKSINTILKSCDV